MIREERFARILKVAKKEKQVGYEQLAALLDVSEDTIRRDIDALHQNGLLQKVRGGAIIPSRNPLTFQDRKGYLVNGKDNIALKAQQFIKKDQTIFMDGGTTICAIAAQFPTDLQLRVVTNNMALVPILSAFPGIELIVLGGLYDRNSQTATGVKTCLELRNYIADVYFMGTCALHERLGISAALQHDGEVKQAMLQSAVRTITLSNAEKLDSVEHFKVCDFGKVDVLITDLQSDDVRLDAYRGQGVQLV